MFDLRSLLDASIACSVALLVVPLARLGLGPGAGPAAYLGAFAGTFVVALAGARSAEALERSVSGWRAVALFSAPVIAFAWFAYRAVDANVILLTVGVGSLAAVPAGAAILIAFEIRLRERSDRVREYARFEARIAPRARRRFVAAFAVVAVGWLGVVVALVAVSGVDDFGPLAASFGGLGGGLAALSTEREVRVTDEGLRVSRTFYEWDAFEAYEVTDDAVIIYRRGWRWSLQFDREDVEDVAAIQDALDRFLRERSR